MRPLLAILGTVVGVAAVGAFGWSVTYHELIFQSFFNPKFEDVRRNTFEQSKSFRDGSIQELENMRFEYVKASPEHKVALKDIIIHRATEVPEDALPQNLYNFIQGLKSN